MPRTELRELQGLPDVPLFALPVPVSEGPPEDTSVYDICIVLPLHFNKSREEYELGKGLYEVLERIIQSIGRKQIYMYDSFYGWSRIVLIRGAASRLKGKAEHLGIKLLLDKEEAKRAAFIGDKEHDIGRIEIVHRAEVTKYEPFDFIYAPYKMNPDLEKLYSKVEGDDDCTPQEVAVRGGSPRGGVGSSPKGGKGGGLKGADGSSSNSSADKEKEESRSSRIFHKSERIELLLAILQDKQSRGGANVNLYEMYSTGAIEGFYPIHNNKAFREKFSRRILGSMLPWKLPLYDIKNYFGAKIAMYNAFTGHIATWVIVPALLGVGCQVSALVLWDYNRIEAAIFALVISIWAVVCYEFWKRKERYLSMEWGTIGSISDNVVHEQVRPTFHGTEIKSYIDGSDILYFEPKNACFRYVFTGFVIFCLMLVALSAVGGLYLARAMLFASYRGEFSQAGASIVNAVLIIILNTIARFVARWLCDLENHRTDLEYEESLIVKLFSFSFINCYTSFYYLAFGAKHMTGYLGVKDQENNEYDATASTAINLAMIFAVRYILLGILVSFVPWIKHWVIKFSKSKKKCRATIAWTKRFFCFTVKNCLCRYVMCRVDLAYGEDTYDEYTLAATATDKVKENKRKRKGLTEEELLEEQQKEAQAEEKERLEKLKHYSPAEKEYRLFAYDLDGLANHYLDQIVIFGYMTLFVAALPGAVMLGLFSLMLQMRGDLWMMLHRYQRPIPQRSESIGLWRGVMEFMIIIAVATNAGIVIFTMTTFSEYTDTQRMGIFVLFQYCVFALQYGLSMAIPDDPKEVLIQRQRQEFLAKKLVEKVPDKEGVDPLALL